MLNKWKRQGLRERVEMTGGKGLLKMVLQRVCLTFKTSLGLRRCLLIKFLPNFPRIMMIGFLVLSLKREKNANSLSKKPTCEKCGKKHYGVCLVGTNNLFGCGKNGTRLEIDLI